MEKVACEAACRFAAAMAKAKNPFKNWKWKTSYEQIVYELEEICKECCKDNFYEKCIHPLSKYMKCPDDPMFNDFWDDRLNNKNYPHPEKSDHDVSTPKIEHPKDKQKKKK